jgi:hypothetical protein
MRFIRFCTDDLTAAFRQPLPDRVRIHARSEQLRSLSEQLALLVADGNTACYPAPDSA